MMRERMGAIAFLVLAASAASAQVNEGPLAYPSAAASSPDRPSKVKQPKPAKAARNAKGVKPHTRKAATAEAPVADAAGAEHAREVPVSNADRRAAPTSGDPIDFGMKWNGANDSAEKTRVQNYGGNAEGTGAEVGLKLHF